VRHTFRFRAFLIAGAACTLLAGQTSAAQIAFTSWAKLCAGRTCFVFMDARTKVIGEDGHSMIDCGPVASAALIEQTGHEKFTLRATFLGARVKPESGTRITIGQDSVIERAFKCFSERCIADYDAGPELVDQLKQATTLDIEVTDAGGSLSKLALPLAGFSDAYDGAPQEPKVSEKVSSKQEMDREMLANTKQRDWCLAHVR
jgi:invasion protein IalB